MASSPGIPIQRASPMFLREAEIRRGVELLFFGNGRLMRSADDVLAKHGLGRAHQRALYFIARSPGLTVGKLLRFLGITKQTLGRVVSELTSRGLLTSEQGAFDRRNKHLRLTEAGAALEAELFDQLRERLSAAYASAGQEAVTGFWQVLEGLLTVDERAAATALSRSPGQPTRDCDARRPRAS